MSIFISPPSPLSSSVTGGKGLRRGRPSFRFRPMTTRPASPFRFWVSAPDQEQILTNYSLILSYSWLPFKHSDWLENSERSKLAYHSFTREIFFVKAASHKTLLHADFHSGWLRCATEIEKFLSLH